MEIPFEKVISTAIEQISTGVQLKVSQIEEQRNRDFMYQMKELEFYKNNYQKDIKDIFDYWFDIVRLAHIKDNKNITEQERQKHQKRYSELVTVDKMAYYQIKTLKYGGTETGRVLATQKKMSFSQDNEQPKYTELYIWCAILAVLKKDVLGQEINTEDIIQVLVNNLDGYKNEIDAAKKYIAKIYKDTYKEEPYWIK